MGVKCHFYSFVSINNLADNPNVSQSQNITLANVICYHHEAINRLVQNLGTKFSALDAAKKLTSSLVEGKTIIMAILQPLIGKHTTP